MRLRAVLLLALLPVVPAATRVAGQDPCVPRPQAVSLQLDLNLPSFQVDAYENAVRIRRYPVAVGMRGYRTPRDTFAITSIEWNPWWIPPNSEWARDEKDTPPGSTNPMGRVKLNFMPLYFLHGTPHVTTLGRAASHGCVRMANADAIALARLVHEVGTPGLDVLVLDSLVADTTLTRLIQLDVPVPLVIRYDVADIDGDTLVLYRDVYGIDRRSDRQRVTDALGTRGIAAERVDSRRLSDTLRSTSRRPLKVAISDLLLADPPDQ